MGFMAGFGPAFAKSFGDARERSDRKADDLFKIKYERAIKRQDEISAYEKEQSKITRAAEALLERSGKPKELLPWVKKQVQAGIGADAISSDLEKGKFDFKPAGANPPSAAPIVDAPFPPAPVDDQMSATGMSPAPTAATEPVPQEEQYQPSGLDGLFGGRVGKMRKEMHTRKSKGTGSYRPGGFQPAEERADTRLQEALGQTPEETNAMMTQPYESETDASGITFTPRTEMETAAEAAFLKQQAIDAGDTVKADLYDDMLKAHQIAENMEGAAMNPQGHSLWIIPGEDGKMEQILARPTPDGMLVDTKGNIHVADPKARQITEEEKEFHKELLKSSPEREKYIKRLSDLEQGYQLSGEVYEIVRKYDGVLSTAATGASALGRFGREIEDAVAILSDNSADQTKKSAAFKKLKDFENSVTGDLLSGKVASLGEARNLLDAKLILASYRFGKAEGQEGRDLSTFDSGRLDQIVKASTDPEIFKENLAQYIMGLESSLEGESRVHAQYNQTIDHLKRTYDYSPFESTAPTPEEFIGSSKNKFASGFRKDIQKYKKSEWVTDDEFNQPEADLPEVSTKEETNNFKPGQKYLRVMPDGTKREFTKQ